MRKERTMHDRPHNRLPNHYDEVVEGSRELIGHHPFATVVTVFGIGMFAGMALVSMMAESEESRLSSTTERIRREVMDAVSNWMPTSVTKAFHR